MKQGDFSKLAKEYINRTGYSIEVLNMLYKYISKPIDQIQVADIGAGTGKLTEQILKLGFNCFAVEPNDEMRAEGSKICKGKKIKWLKGSGEDTGLQSNSIDWVLMASSFHWTDHTKSIKEFHRILKPKGFFTALWNPRNLDSSKFHTKIEKIIYSIAPKIKRVSSGSKKYTVGLEKKLLFNNYFNNLIFVEGDHEENMTKERYLGAWKSVNDIRAQAGEKNWKKILTAIEKEIKNHQLITVPYKTRSWTVQKK